MNWGTYMSAKLSGGMRGLALGLSISSLFILVSCSGIQSRYHEVQAGENLDSIARRYDIPVRELARYNSDQVSRNSLRAGAKLYIPFEESEAWDGDTDVAPRADVAQNPNAIVTTAPFSWPVGGAITSKYGWRKRRMHDGIDIAARTGTPVNSARSGHVLYAGNKIKGYGNLVIVKHADSFSTVYAHLSKIDVKKGQFVSRGQRVGRVGRTGRATAPHLHFEVRNSRVPVDPLLYLQGKYAANRITGR